MLRRQPPRHAPARRPRAPRLASSRISCRRAFRTQRLLAQRSDDLADDRDRDFGGADRADVEPDRRMDALERRFIKLVGANSFDPFGVRLSRSELADIETIG